MKSYLVSDLREGMKADHPVFIDPYHVFLYSYDPLNGEDLEKLKKWGIQEVYSHGKISLDDLQQSSQESSSSAISPSISRHEQELRLTIIKQRYQEFRANVPAFLQIVQKLGKEMAKQMQILVQQKSINTAFELGSLDAFIKRLQVIPMMLLVFQYIRFTSNWELQHSLHCAAYSIIFAQNLGYVDKEIHHLALAVLFMNAGMFSIPSFVREKGTDLGEHEKNYIKAHPILSYKLLSKARRGQDTMRDLAIQHHEAYDGSGYPRGLKGDEISEDAMIAKICDVYTASIEERHYRSPKLPSVAIRELLSKHIKTFNPKMARAFAKMLSLYPIGSFVKLSDASTAMVIEGHPQKALLPTVRLMRNNQNQPYPGFVFLDLSHREDLQIKNTIWPASLKIQVEKEL